jgi:hypothetical protein
MTEQEDNTSNTGPASTETDETPEGGTSGTPDAENGSQGGSKLHQEAARYRVRAKEAEAALAAAQERVEALQRSDIERVAGEVLSMPGDFWLSENDLSAYLNDQGHVDYDRVREDARLLVTERPGLQKPKFTAGYDPTQGYGGRTDPKREPTLVDLFKGSTRQPY